MAVAAQFKEYCPFLNHYWLQLCIGDVIIIPLMVWLGTGIRRWIPNCVVIPKKRENEHFPAHLEGRVKFRAGNMLAEKGCPVLAYNCNNYAGGMKGNLMSQFMAKYFPDTDKQGVEGAYDFEAFCKCYEHPKTQLFILEKKKKTKDADKSDEQDEMAPLGIELSVLDKEVYVAPRAFRDVPGAVAEAGDREPIPHGAVLALYLEQSETDSSIPPYAFFLATTWVKIGSRTPHSDTETLIASLKTLWRVAERLLGGTDTQLCLPCLCGGSGHLNDGTYSVIWAIVSTYRMAYLQPNSAPGMQLCIPPDILRHYNVRDVLKLMNYALCNA